MRQISEFSLKSPQHRWTSCNIRTRAALEKSKDLYPRRPLMETKKNVRCVDPCSHGGINKNLLTRVRRMKRPPCCYFFKTFYPWSRFEPPVNGISGNGNGFLWSPNYVIKLTADEKMTKYRKHGYKSASTSGRYSKVAAAQYLRWSRQNTSSDHDFISSKQGRLDISGYSYKKNFPKSVNIRILVSTLFVILRRN